MGDVVFVVLVIAFFGIAVGAVRLCERVVRSADLLATTSLEETAA